MNNERRRKRDSVSSTVGRKYGDGDGLGKRRRKGLKLLGASRQFWSTAARLVKSGCSCLSTV